MDLYTIRNMLSQGKNIYDLPLRVTFYARVSTDRYEQLNSLENQVTYFSNFIKEQENWIFVEGYVDEGISGTSVKKRADFLRMLDDAKKRKFDLILTMTKLHKYTILNNYKEGLGKVFTLKEYVKLNNIDKDIIDPYGGSYEDYKLCANEIRDCLYKLIEIQKGGLE